MVHYTEPSRYNWMLQYYLRAEGLALSWVGTGRLIFSLNYTDADFAAVADRFVAAAEKMKRDGWWWHDASLTNKNIKRQILKEMLAEKAAAVNGQLALCRHVRHSRRMDGALRYARPSTFSSPQVRQDVDARDKAGHDERCGMTLTLRRA